MRASRETKRLRNEADALLRSGTAAERARFMKEPGIKRKPVLSALRMSFAYDFPHGPMHLLLLRWVKRVAALLAGKDDRRKGKNCSHIISEERQELIDDSLRPGATTITSA